MTRKHEKTPFYVARHTCAVSLSHLKRSLVRQLQVQHWLEEREKQKQKQRPGREKDWIFHQVGKKPPKTPPKTLDP